MDTATQKRHSLMTILCSEIILAFLIIALYETNVILEGGMAGDVNAEFIITMAMELLTIAAIPVALKLFKIKHIEEYIKAKGVSGHYKMAMTRMHMLTLPMLLNIILYYAYMKVAFAYLAIILAISLIFIIPTKQRCDSEL